jgi:hypothetical protein
VGLALVRDAEVLGAEPFFHEFIAGMERVLVPLAFPDGPLSGVQPSVDAKGGAGLWTGKPR